MYSPAITNQEKKSREGNAKHYEPVGLIKQGSDTEFQSGSLLVPNTVVIASNNAKFVVARTQVTVVGLPPLTDLLPICIQAFKPVAKLDSLGYRQAQGGIVDFNI